MKILFLSNLLPPYHIGGYEIACLDTFNLLKRRGIDCAILTSDYKSTLNDIIDLEEEKRSIYRILNLHTDFKNDSNCLPFHIVDQSNAQKVEAFIQKYSPDIIYCWNLWGLGTRIINLCSPDKTIFHLMDLSIFNYDFSFVNYLKYLLLRNRCKPINLKRRMKNVIFISEFVSSRFDDFNFFNSIVIYPFLKGLETYTVKEFYEPENVLSGVFVGQIEKHKGILDLCVVINTINSEQGFNKIVLTIYGSSQSKLDTSIINEYGSFVTIINNCPRISIINNLNTFDIGFFPSVWEEPFGIAQIEMMSVGLPVISSARGGSKEVLNSSNSIIYNDNEELKNELMQLISNYQNVAKNKGQKARNDIAEKFGEVAYFQEVSSFLTQVCK